MIDQGTSTQLDKKSYGVEFGYFVAEMNQFYLHNPKAGSTTMAMLWALIEGFEPTTVCDTAPWPELQWEQSIHSLTWRLRGIYVALPEALKYHVSVSPNVDRVGFVRDPIERFWSAWVSKVLTREPAYRHLDPQVSDYSSQQWIQRIREPRLLVQEFRRFVKDFLLRNLPASRDEHFLPQAEIFGEAVTNSEFHHVSQLASHLSRLESFYGLEIPTNLKNANKGLRQIPGLLSATQYRDLQDFYEADYRLWGSLFKVTSKRFPQNWSRFELDILIQKVLNAQRLSVVWDERTRLLEELSVLTARVEAKIED